jgi:hypothetical protein
MYFLLNVLNTRFLATIHATVQPSLKGSLSANTPRVLAPDQANHGINGHHHNVRQLPTPVSSCICSDWKKPTRATIGGPCPSVVDATVLK